MKLERHKVHYPKTREDCSKAIVAPDTLFNALTHVTDECDIRLLCNFCVAHRCEIKIVFSFRYLI